VASAQTAVNKVEILSVDFLNTHRDRVNEMLGVYRSLGLGLGWHYLLDLSWAAAELDAQPGATVLDAGAGIGLIQWWLASRGVNVISVDTKDRAELDRKFREWCTIRGLRPSDLRKLPSSGLREFLPSLRPWRWHRWPSKVRDAMNASRRPQPPAGSGTITIYNQDLSRMSDVADESVDAVVSISALEHNTPDGLRVVVRELMRVLKPGGRLVATLGAARDEDWFHEPSHGWNYTDTTLRSIFDLPPDAPSNYARHDELLQALRSSTEMRDHLDPYYSTSGDNGMPWGVWDPKYIPVGVVKTKPA
jgi:SAM-dependent methyltransferase